jgi:hypothetical protein
MGLRFAILALFGLGCGIAAADEVPLPHPRPQMPLWIEPHSFAEAVAGLDFDSAAVTSEPTECDKRLAVVAVTKPMPRLIGPGACGGGDMIELDGVLLADKSSAEIKPAAVLRCAMAEQLALWLREDAGPRLAALGSSLRSVENADDFECRGRNRVIDAKLSEHGKGNAMDVRAFTLSDGRRLALTDTGVARDLREALRESACRRFSTVLGPGSDGYHEVHIHLDVAERARDFRICQWDVRSLPPDAAQVPLPRPRPAEFVANTPQKP